MIKKDIGKGVEKVQQIPEGFHCVSNVQPILTYRSIQYTDRFKNLSSDSSSEDSVSVDSFSENPVSMIPILMPESTPLATNVLKLLYFFSVFTPEGMNNYIYFLLYLNHVIKALLTPPTFKIDT